jgi:protein kinase-like protein/Sel1 repeat-containing protein
MGVVSGGPPDGLPDAAVARLRASVRQAAHEDTFGGRFTLVGEAGAGGMGVVYEAIDRDSDRRVAIKVITGLPSPSERARFVAEAEVLERLDHPAIVDYVSHGVTVDGEPYIAMEWLVGESLEPRLKRGALSIRDAVVLGERIADALDHAHRAGVVHRDLKPSNVFLVDGNVAQAHLIDFGVAKLADSELTRTGQVVGTPGYMAPEQARGDKAVTASADLFALGCVLYRALTGQAPFGGVEVMEVLARLLLEHPQPVDELVPDVPPRLAHLVGSLLAKETSERLGDAAIACGELRAIRDALAAHDTTALELLPEAVPAPRTEVTAIDRPARRRRAMPGPRWWPIAAAGAAVVVAGGVVLLLARAGAGGDAICTDAARTGCAVRCDANDAAACYLLARALHTGVAGMPVDHEAARVADERACRLRENRGCVAAAKSLLAVADKVPAGDPRRGPVVAEAAQLLATGCERGAADACRLLGREYSQGFGHLPPDPPRAFALVEQACNANDVVACKALQAMILDPNNGGTPELRAGAQRVYGAACARALPELACSR